MACRWRLHLRHSQVLCFLLWLGAQNVAICVNDYVRPAAAVLIGFACRVFVLVPLCLSGMLKLILIMLAALFEQSLLARNILKGPTRGKWRVATRLQQRRRMWEKTFRLYARRERILRVKYGHWIARLLCSPMTKQPVLRAEQLLRRCLAALGVYTIACCIVGTVLWTILVLLSYLADPKPNPRHTGQFLMWGGGKRLSITCKLFQRTESCHETTYSTHLASHGLRSYSPSGH